MPDLPLPKAPYILLTNDDGIGSPALALLAARLREIADVVVLAPEHNWSAAGHSKTMHKPLRVAPGRLHDGSRGWASSGSPSDCVALALLGLVPHPPALVLSGINVGANVGQDLTYSGTVAAAMEAVIGGVPAIAVSLDTDDARHPDTAARFAAHLARHVLGHGAEATLLLNVNVPDRPGDEIAGVEVTRLGQRLYRDALVTRTDPRGRTYYWIGGDPPGGVPDAGTDIGALARGCISVTPIRLDLTAHDRLAELERWDLGRGW